jgi:uncharacterized membrane protein YeaQ/YmgE (transglycosylase-associated protein family)
MGELFPIVAGILVGIIASRIARGRMRALVGVALTVLFGVTATLLSGEARESWAFVFVDLGLVALAAVIAWGAATLASNRLAEPR